MPGKTKSALTRTFLLMLLATTALAECSRNRAPMTACVGDKPEVPRIHDVGPPNCPKK
ncbi:MAG: hypothetical protein JSR87_09790 [Proteobacteria bacterium]|nr:hypothetical protein [Pseudomonadota bacterium]